MPIYTYRCKECNHQFEQRQHMSEEPLTICPVCEGRVRRVVNPVGVVFKGSGFYVTDNRGNNSANNNRKPATSDEKGATAESSNAKSKSVPSDAKSKSNTTSSASVAAG